MAEDHNVYCEKCAENLGPCTERDCEMRHYHSGGLCAACQKDEERVEWEA